MSASTIEAKRIALVLVVLLSDLLFTGLIFGWAPFLLILQDEQQYAELCEADGVDAPCIAQENQLNLIFAAASVAANIGALPIGMFLDYFGPMITIVFAGILEISGLVLLALADSQTFDVFVPAYVLLAFGGCVTMMSSFPASFLLIKYQTAILAAISCLFDGSSVVFLVLYSIRSTYEIERRELLLGLAAFAVGLYLVLIMLWHVNERALADDDDATETDILLPVLDRTHSLDYETIKPALSQKQQTLASDAVLVDQPLRKQVWTFEYGFILAFAVVQVLRANLYIGTTNKLLENYGDIDQEYFYTKLFSVVLPVGFLFVPGIDHVVEKKGLTMSLVVTNSLGAAFNAMELVPSLALQALTFFVFTGFRAFLYAVTSAFTAKTFGLKNLGTLVGIMFTASSIVSLLEYPAVLMSNAYFDGDLSAVNALSLVLCVALFPAVEWYRGRQQLRHGRLRALHAPMSDAEASPSVNHGLAYLRSPCRRQPGRLSHTGHANIGAGGVPSDSYH